MVAARPPHDNARRSKHEDGDMTSSGRRSTVNGYHTGHGGGSVVATASDLVLE